jgi:H+-translocating NAD(P) transhydrogenase subunit alpha
VILASTLTNNLAILVLAGFVGYVVISKVPNTLHTPLMSGTNAIHGIVVLGGLLLLGVGGLDAFSKFLLVIAVAFGTINVVGGFLVTDRMLEMFKSRPKPPLEEEAGGGQTPAVSESRAGSEPRAANLPEPPTEPSGGEATEGGGGTLEDGGGAPGDGGSPESRGGAPGDAGALEGGGGAPGDGGGES